MSTNQTSQKGIDIQQALSILSDRTNPENHSTSSHEKHGGGCGCHGDSAPQNAKQMGQTIDLLAKKSNEEGQEKSSEEERQKEQQRIAEERAKRRQEIQEELKSMTAHDLLQAVFKAQQDRVATYKEYESGLMVVIDTGNFTSYPDTCSKATASFSVLSETIKMIQEILEFSARSDLSKLIQRLQSYEKEKLQLTAAHHLERIRQRNQQELEGEDSRISKLLKDGVGSLRQKIATCIENINEVLDELRCSLLDEE